MIQSQFIEQVNLRAKNIVAREFREWETIKQCANFGYVFAWAIAMRQMRWFYQKSLAFTATSNVVTKPTDCHQLLSVEIPGTDMGHATPVGLEEFDMTQSMTEQAGSPSNPKFREDHASIQLFPFQDANNANFNGTFHYLRNIPYIDDDTFELSVWNANALPIFPEIFEEDAVTEAVRQLLLRSKGMGDSPGALDSLLDGYEDLMAQMQRGLDPAALYGERTPRSLGYGRGLPQS